MSRGLRRIVLPLLERAARSYVSGPELADALTTSRELKARGVAVTIGLWNERGDAADAILATHHAAIDAVAEAQLDAYLSIKAPPLGGDATRIVALAEHARRVGGAAWLHLDAHGLDTQDQNFALADALAPILADVGVTLPGRWVRSLADAERASARGFRVRVVKGQWPDEVGRDKELRQGFLDVVERLAGRAAVVMVATHDPELAARSLDRLRAAGTPVELEVLLGLPMQAVVEVARARGVKLRCYVPYGHGFLPYGLAQAAKNPALLVRMLRDAGRGRPVLP